MSIFNFGSLMDDGLDQESMLSFLRSKLGPRIEAEISALRERSKVRLKDIDRSDLVKIVFEETGIRSKIKGISGEYNAFAMFPTLSADHVFYDTYDNKEVVRDYFNIKKPEEARIGWVNIKAGRIGGYFSEIMHEMGIGQEFFNDSRFTDAEITGIMLHEIGHLFYYYHKLTFVRSTNYYMDHLAKEASEIKDPEQRIAFLTKKQLKRGDLKSMSEYKNAQNKEQIMIIMHSDLLEEAGSDLGINNYDTRGWEYLADRYANSQGYGDSVASGLNKMYDIYGMQKNTPRWAHILTQTITLLALTVFTYGIAPLIILGLIDTLRPVYDDPRKRFEVIRKDMIGQLRLLEMDPKEKAKIIKKIDNMDDILKDYGPDMMGVFEFLQATFGPSGRKRYRHMNVQKTLEHFANSELRLRAERLNS